MGTFTSCSKPSHIMTHCFFWLKGLFDYKQCSLSNSKIMDGISSYSFNIFPLDKQSSWCFALDLPILLVFNHLFFIFLLFLRKTMAILNKNFMQSVFPVVREDTLHKKGSTKSPTNLEPITHTRFSPVPALPCGKELQELSVDIETLALQQTRLLQKTKVFPVWIRLRGFTTDKRAEIIESIYSNKYYSVLW